MNRPLPLRSPDPDVSLDLQPILDRAYEQAAYELRIDYSSPPEPPLTDEHDSWTAELIAAGASQGAGSGA